MSTFLALSLILLAAMALIGGRKGITSFAAFFFNIFLFLVILVLLNKNFPLWLAVFPGCLLIAAINLFFVNEYNLKTKTAFVSTIATLVLVIGLIYLLSAHAHIQGFGAEETEELGAFQMNIGISFQKIIRASLILSMMGAITDSAMAIASTLVEVHLHDPAMPQQGLFLSGMRMARDILGTTVNTLFFAFVGSYLGLIIWFGDLAYSASAIVNSKIFAEEMLTAATTGIGAIVILPVTALICSWAYSRPSIKNPPKKE